MPNAQIPTEIYDKFETLANSIKATGARRYSADAILHRIRWFYHVERGDADFKCNNNWTAVLARWYLNRYPDMPKFFETRHRRVVDGYS